MLNHNTLDKLNLYRYDPVAYLLIEKLRLNYIAFGILTFIVTDALYLVTAWLSNTLWTQATKGLLDDRLVWAGTLIASIIWEYYLWSYYAINQLVYGLEMSDVIETNPAEIDEIIRNIYCNRWRVFGALLIAAVFSFMGFFTQKSNERGWLQAFWPNLVGTFVIFLGIYICSMLVFNLLANIRVLSKIIGDKPLQINPFHPDRCGGLRSLSDYSLNTTYLIALFGFLVGIIELGSQFTQGNWHVRLLIPL